MEKINEKKMKSILTAMFLILSVISAFIVVMPTTVADPVDTDIVITSPVNDTLYFLTSNVTITWANTSGGAFANLDGFLINISGPAFSNTWYNVKNVTDNTQLTWYWNVSDYVSRGEWGLYKINVTGYQYNANGLIHWTGNGVGGNWTNHIRIMPTPGINAWQGGNFDITTNFTDNKVLKTDVSDLKYDPDGGYTTIEVDSTRGWNSSTTYFLYKPYYNGSYQGTYALTWEQVDDATDTEGTDGTKIEFSGGSTDDEFLGVEVDRAGLWIISNTTDDNNWITHDVFDSYTHFNNTVAAWFWVNTTRDDADFVFSISETSFEYNSSGYITLSVKDSSDNGVNAIVDVRLDANGSSIASGGQNVGIGTDGEDIYYKNKTNNYDGFWNVGNYTAYAYDDLDSSVGGYLENNLGSSTVGRKHYNDTYGAGTNWFNGANATWLSGATAYHYGMCGPWDPPELDATPETIYVEPATPYISVDNETQYWGFDGIVNITIREASDRDGSLTAANTFIEIWDDDGICRSNDTTAGTTKSWSYFGGWGGSVSAGAGAIDDSNIHRGWILINMTKWGKRGDGDGNWVTFADNGTWTATIFVDTNSDRTNTTKAYSEEWNGTAEWTVKKAPSAQWKWIDDDGDVTPNWNNEDNRNNDGVIPFVPNSANVPLYVQFQILSQGGNYFGALPGSGKCTSVAECMENITLSGNALFTGTLDKIPGVDYNAATYAWCGASNTWTVPIIPTISNGGGTITITAKAFNSTSSGTLTIGGTMPGTNGTIVSVTPNEIEIGQQDQTLTVTSTHASDGSAKTNYCSAYLYYLNDTGAPYTTHEINGTNLGEATMPFYKTQQKANQTSVDFDGDGATSDSEIKAPRNLTVYVDGPGSEDHGYALIQMNPVSDFMVELSQEEFMSGYAYDGFTITCTIAGSNGTETPNTDAADRNAFHVKFYDENDNDVSGSLLNGITASDLTGDADYVYGGFNNAYATNDGTYTVFAKNNTHNSNGNNATLTVKPVSVVCDKDPFIWKSDNNITATFTITYDGEAVNGSLLLDNISTSSPTTGDDFNKTWANCSFSVSSQTDAAGNTSLEINENDITDGKAIVNDLTAAWLPNGVTNKTITFFFKPSQSSSVYAKAGTMKVRVPTVAIDPMYIALGETTRVSCMVTGRGDAGLNSVYVRAHGVGGIDTNGTSDATGEVAFSLTPNAVGNISLDVGEEGRTLDTDEAVIKVTAWQLNIELSPDTVDEGEDFTVIVTEATSGDFIEGATVTIAGIGTATTNADGEATFKAPTVTSDRSYAVKASKAGYAPEPDTISIFVTNIPELIISADAEVQTGATFEVVVAKDTGDPVIGATVTFNGETYKTKAGGIATLTAPDKEGDYTITASFKDFIDGETTITVKPGTPGFELLTLIAAIGVAFILLRRRRKN